jgi:hypothetical protein
MGLVVLRPREGRQKAGWRVLVGTLGALAVAGTVWIAITEIDPGLWLGNSVGIALLIVGTSVVMVSCIFMLLSGNKQFLSGGRGWGRFFDRYFHVATKWMRALHLALALAGLGLIVHASTLSGINLEVEHTRGHYVELGDSGERGISVAEYTRLVVANTEFTPIGVNFLILDLGLVFLLGDRAERAENAADVNSKEP